MKQLEFTQSSLPEDIALKIASSLEVNDLCALGSCSRYWSELCGSDCIWESLTRQRWPFLDTVLDPTFKGWRGFYIEQHNEMVGRAATVVKFVKECSLSGSLEVGVHLKAIEALGSMQLGFQDVQMLLFKPKHNVLLNLVGLHYCINCLNVPAGCIVKALQSCKISDSQVCVKWWKLGRWFHGFRMRDESHSRCVSLADLAMAKEEEVLRVLHRGAIHEVLRVQISTPGFTSTPWFTQGTERLC
ncbi:F-box-like domain-containing protein [Cephalotus follicularis]|uniref:F-box-like domain-containing protein n=1 Tax=Cephalotus follicularis TaxID=3775 RepID=A0A1Q3D4H1_CEPFO|nr:F-box-like domain-containing protein [Cephalotus follicularis]